MLGYIAAALFIIAFITNAGIRVHSRHLPPAEPAAAWPACLALHLARVGTGWSFGGRGRRR